MKRATATVLTIAGSDSGGAAGIQADLKTFAAFGLHGTSAITAVTSQNLHEVVSIHCVPSRELESQIRTVFGGFDVAAVKIGMLGSAANVAVVAKVLRDVRARNIVLDPVLVSSSGTPLLSARGIAVLSKELIPLTALLTPNLPEAGVLLGRRVAQSNMDEAARDLLALGAGAVLVKGGHGRGSVVRDVLASRRWMRDYSHPRLALHARGTGCVLASAIACGLGGGRALPDAVEVARRFLQQALRAAVLPGGRSLHVLRPAPLREI